MVYFKTSNCKPIKVCCKHSSPLFTLSRLLRNNRRKIGEVYFYKNILKSKQEKEGKNL
jgi:hypothetical protein